MSTKIEWTKNDDGTQGKTWNPCHGCTKISEGCRHCYAEKMARRQKAMGNYPNGFDVDIEPSKLSQPLHWRKSQNVFVCSMGDLFHSDMPRNFIRAIYGVMAATQHHTYQVLTKRPGNMAELTRTMDGMYPAHAKMNDAIRQYPDAEWFTLPTGCKWPLLNVWHGTTVESAKHKGRIDQLRKVPAVVRFLSCEPLLGDLGTIDLTGIDWVIVGGESGNAKTVRPMHPDWVQNIRGQCNEQGVRFFFKQWGTWGLEGPLSARQCVVADNGAVFEMNDVEGMRKNQSEYGRVHRQVMYRVGKKAAGRIIDGRTWDERPDSTA
jgi:protein gp37